MKFEAIKRKEGKISGLVALERIISRRARAKIKSFLMLVVPFLLLIVFIFEEESFISPDIIYGLMFLTVALWLKIFMLDAFYYAHYFRSAHFSLPEWGIAKYNHGIPFEILEIVSGTHTGDLVAGFLESRAGKDMLTRLDIPESRVKNFLDGQREKVYTTSVSFMEPVSLVSFATTVFDSNKDLKDFLAGQDINRDEFLNTASWVGAIYERQKEAHRWWGRDSLGRIRGIAKDWSHHDTYLLEQYGIFVESLGDETIFRKEIDELEWILARTSGADAILIADKPEKLEAVVSGLFDRIQDGSVLPQLEHKKILILNAEAIDKASTGEGQFEALIIRLFNQAIDAGNLVLVIKDLPGFISLARRHNVDLLKILDLYLNSPQVHVIGFASRRGYHDLFSSDSKIATRFAHIFVENEDTTIITRALEHRTFNVERVTHFFFTYQALRAIAKKASVGSPDTVVESRSLELFETLLPKFVERRLKKITAKDVEVLVD